MQFRKIPWKYDEGFGIGGAWYGDLVIRYFIWPGRRDGKFKVTVGLNNREVGHYATLEAAKKGAQADLEKLVMTAIVPEQVTA